MPKIAAVHAHEILDSRGNPTVSVSVLLSDGATGSASVPSGASTGTHEALELRDGDPKRYGGKGVLKAARHVEGVIEKRLVGEDAYDQRLVDDAMRALDGTSNKAKLGANAILGVSLAVAHAAARSSGQPLYRYLRDAFDLSHKTFRLPQPTMNILNGGAHAHWCLDIQEFMVVPQQKRFREAVRCGAEIFHALGAILHKRGLSAAVGDEGGYAVSLPRNEDGLKLIASAIKTTPYRLGKEVLLAMDPAVSEWYDEKSKRYLLRHENKTWTARELMKYWKGLMKKYPFVSLEDVLAEDDWEHWAAFTKDVGRRVSLVGDDFFVTNPTRLARGIQEHCANAILIKVNQIGTLSETIDAITMAQKAGYKVSVSHRSGETTDTTIADLAVAVNADFIKTGSLSRGERVAKYNRLMEIEEELAYG